MMEIIIADVGEFILKPNARNRKIGVRWEKNKFIVSYPAVLTQKQILAELNSMKDQLLEFKQKVSVKTSPEFIFTENQLFKTPHFDVWVEKNNLSSSLVSYSENRLIISLRKDIDISTQKIQQAIKRIIEETCREQAKRIVPARLSMLAKENNFKFKNLKINKSRGRWGSCSSLGNINISLYCMMLPLHLLDLVLLHELCHTVVMNHSKSFWDLLDKVTNGKSQQLTKELKQFNLGW